MIEYSSRYNLLIGKGAIHHIIPGSMKFETLFFSCCSSVSSKGTIKNNNKIENNLSRKKPKSSKNDRNGKIPTVPCPYCGKQCSYLNKHIRDVHQPKVHCPVCGKRMGKSYLSEHMKIQHQGKEVPTKVN